MKKFNVYNLIFLNKFIYLKKIFNYFFILYNNIKNNLNIELNLNWYYILIKILILKIKKYSYIYKIYL